MFEKSHSLVGNTEVFARVEVEEKYVHISDLSNKFNEAQVELEKASCSKPTWRCSSRVSSSLLEFSVV